MHTPLNSSFHILLTCILVSVPVFVWADSLQTIDDRDLRMQYSGGWTAQGGPSEYDSSTMLTQNHQATALLIFTGTLTTFSLFPLLSIVRLC